MLRKDMITTYKIIIGINRVRLLELKGSLPREHRWNLNTWMSHRDVKKVQYFFSLRMTEKQNDFDEALVKATQHIFKNR